MRRLISRNIKHGGGSARPGAVQKDSLQALAESLTQGNLDAAKKFASFHGSPRPLERP